MAERSVVGPERFVGWLRDMPAVEIDHVAARIEAQHDSAADEVDAWRVTIAIDRNLRQLHRTREAARWAHHATDAVRLSAAKAGLSIPDEHVTAVARSAAEVSRALVVGEPCLAELGWLLRAWSSYLVARTAQVERPGVAWDDPSAVPAFANSVSR